MSSTSASPESRLCVQCNLCCNGVLFADVKLQSADPQAPLKAAGIPLRKRGRFTAFAQPCVALQADGCCSAYGNRPTMCQKFECGVLRQVAAGQMTDTSALKLIRRTQKLAQKVTALLRLLGNHDEARPLTKRYQAVMRTPIDLSDPDAGDLRGELMMAVAGLMTLAQSRFLNVSQ